MKKNLKTLSLLLLFSVAVCGQNATPFTNIKLTANVKDNDATRMLVQDTLTKKISWVLKSTVGKLKSVTGTDGVTVALGTTTPVVGLGNIKPISVISNGLVIGSNLTNVDNTNDLAKPVSTAAQTALDLKSPLFSPTFTGTVSGVTKSMVGLSLADNTNDLAKPVSTATRASLDLKEDLVNKTSVLEPSIVLYPNNNSVLRGLSELDATVVHITKNEIVDGEKTFLDKLTAESFIKTNGLISQNLLADGSVFDKYNKSISTSVYFETMELVPQLIGDMVDTPDKQGTYKVDFNGQFNIVSNISLQASIELNELYLDLNSKQVTNQNFPTFGAGTTITPGVYETITAKIAAGTVTLDGGGDPNSVFIFKAGGAFSFGAGSTLNLINGASSSNVYYLIVGAGVIGASATVSGTIVSPIAAFAVGAGSSLNGRVFSIGGAVSTLGNITVPSSRGQISIGKTLSEFAMFSSNGAVSNAGSNVLYGNIGSNTGTILGFDNALLTGFIYEPGNLGSSSIFSIYVDDIIIPTSTRERLNAIKKTDVILSEQVTINPGQKISVKILNQSGISRFYNRILTVTKI